MRVLGIPFTDLKSPCAGNRMPRSNKDLAELPRGLRGPLESKILDHTVEPVP